MRRGGEEPPRWEENKVSKTAEHKLTSFHIEENQDVTLQYNPQIQTDILKKFVQSFYIGKTTFFQPIQSLLAILEAAEDLGVPKSMLPQLQKAFVTLCIPGLKGQMFQDTRNIKSN